MILVANGRFRVLQTSLLLYGNVVFKKSRLGKVGIPTPFFRSMSKHEPLSLNTFADGAESESDDGLEVNPDFVEPNADTDKTEGHSHRGKRTFEQAAEHEAVEGDEVELSLPLMTVAQKIPKLEVIVEDTKVMEEATRLRNSLIEAKVFEQHQRIKPLFRRLEQLKMTKAILAQTGLGFLVMDYTMWPKGLDAARITLRSNWRLS